MQEYRNNNQQNQGFNNRNQPQQRNAGYQTQQDSAAERKFKELHYNPEWITKEADDKLVKYAEDSGKFMATKGLTNSKIRSIYGEIKRIQMGEFEQEKSAFVLLKPKVAYALGRDDRNEGLKLFKLIFDCSSQNVTDQKSFNNFCNFMEAILAYHKANGGKD
ncbi:MAG: type III-A CRISPR-associated protein Csm2 [Dysgonamonadaceae bacterium]|jgi:CRISPR-associated protein Csm2|nr:type III-A CRISPR-associated protein Csm2 [Dysgonamonadaceae bacterium]